MQNVNESEERAATSNGVIDVVRQVVSIIVEKQISGFAQMVAYNVLFATAPLLMVITAGAASITRTVNSEFDNPAQPVLQWMQDSLPQETSAFLQQPIERAVNADTSWLFSTGALLALWGARGAVAAVIRGLNVAYGIGKDPRPFLIQTLRSLGLTILLILLVAFGGLVFTLGTDFGDRIASVVGLGDLWSKLSVIVRWPLVATVSVVAVMTLHRYGPAEKGPFKWYLPGSMFSVVGMYVTTVGLGIWFAQSDGFSEAYGIFGSVLVFVMWLYLMAFVLLVGGVINAVVHRRYAVEKHLRS